MDVQLIILCWLTFIIHLIGTLAYSVRIAGIRTRKIAVSFALFNVLVLVSRTANSFQSPFLAKRVERSLALDPAAGMLIDFRWLLLSASVATVAGAFLIPSFQRLFSKAVLHFQVHRSLPRLLLHSLSFDRLVQLKEAFSLPASENFTKLRFEPVVSPGVLLLNMLAVALWTVGVFASIYAGALNPDFRSTANSLSSIVNGGATVLMFVLIDPHISMMTDDVMEGRLQEASFRRAVVWLVASRFAGTLLAQAIFVPAATLVVFIAEHM